MYYKTEFFINKKLIRNNAETYFIADIAANHDGSLSRALELINLAHEAGANCAKFQHFKAKKIVSDVGFQGEFKSVSHQSKWDKSIFQVYDEYHTRDEWTEELVSECEKLGIDFMTTPYDKEAVDNFDQLMPAFKVGSGDITFENILTKIASKNKPVFLATGASNISEVKQAVATVLNLNSNLCLMQCNTNYTGNLDNFRSVNLNVLKTFESIWPGMPLGLSDHTPGHTAVLGAVALGARVIEKHFTDDNFRTGPDHKFALNPKTWSEMVEETRNLEVAMGDGVKVVEDNELETVHIQRRCLRIKSNVRKGTIITPDLIECLRPCPKDGLSPFDLEKVIGLKIQRNIKAGEHLSWNIVE